MKKTTLIIALFITFVSYSQKIITMEKAGGTYIIPCKVNGIPMKFTFDTGASSVSISSTEAKFLIKQGLLTDNDIKEKTKYSIANGDIIEGTKIILREISIDGFVLKNVEASVIHNQNASLLLGQSAIERIGRYSILGNKLTLLDYTTEVTTNTKPKIIRNNSINEGALKYLNSFLSDKSIMANTKKSLVFNAYTSSLDYSSTMIMYEDVNEKVISAKLTVDFSAPINNITKVVEHIAFRKGKASFMLFDIYLNENVKYTRQSKRKGEFLDKKIGYLKIVRFSTEKELSNSDVEKIQRAIRDVFIGAEFETETKHYK